MRQDTQQELESVVARPIRIFTDGAGMRSDGKGSGFAWLREDTGERKIVRQDGLTNNQAEYRGILLALECLPEGALVEICTDSEVVCRQLNRLCVVKNPKAGFTLRCS